MLEKQGYNIGSICRIEVVSEQDVLTMPDEYKGRLIGSLTLKPEAEWTELYNTRDTPHFVEATAAQVHGMVLKFSAPKDSAASLEAIYNLELDRFIVRITDRNKVVKIAGRPNEGCAITCEMRDHGSNRRDKNHYAMAIRLSRTDRVPVATV